jgi:hypothetical protein
VKGVALWALGAVAAFLATAGAFLLLANLGGGAAASDPIPRAEPSEAQDPGPTLVLELFEDQLEELEREPGQKLTVGVENVGDEEFSSVDLTLDVTSGNTVQPHTRSYQKTIEQIAPNESTTAEFEIDLSPPIPPEDGEGSTGPDSQTREILEAKATTPEGASAIKTAVLAP